MRWFVLDMDEGVLRIEASRKAAVDWWKGMCCGDKVIQRYSFGPGAYEYIVGTDETEASGAFIEREDVAAERGGWDIGQRPLYPLPDKPFHRYERDEELPSE